MKRVNNNTEEMLTMESSIHCEKCGHEMQVAKVLRTFIDRVTSVHADRLTALKKEHEKQLAQSLNELLLSEALDRQPQN
jgi:hypothetical protein